MNFEISEIDLIYPRWHNNLAIAGGALTSLVATVALAKIGEAIAGRFVDWERSTIVKGAVLGGALFIGVASGHIITTQIIGLIAKSTLAKFSVSLGFSCLGGIAGLTIYTATRKWI